MSEIRTYIVDQVRKVQATLKEWNEAAFKDVPLNKIDESFSISLGDHASDQQGLFITDTVPVEIKITKINKNKKGAVTVDSCLELGKKIRNEISHPKN